jgi:hypothetical protein
MATSSTDITLTVAQGGKAHELVFGPKSTLTDLSLEIESRLSIPTANQKLLVPKLGLLKHPFNDPELSLASFADKKITLMGSTDAAVSSIQSAESMALARQASRLAISRRPKPNALRSSNREHDKYTFTTIRPLEWLPHPERSLAMLQRLAADPGIRSAMRTHRLSVALLTEMEPLSNTQSTHEGTTRLLGLNRNNGEVIELRLRTDAHDGYRDYATVRRTLCHELAHNVHSSHDSQFWALCKQIEREVESVARGRVIGGGEDIGRYSAPERDDATEEDNGGWTGGEFVLGVSGTSTGTPERSGLNRREVLARAAEERARRAQEDKEQSGAGT